jgi:hypothetical protein
LAFCLLRQAENKLLRDIGAFWMNFHELLMIAYIKKPTGPGVGNLMFMGKIQKSTHL